MENYTIRKKTTEEKRNCNNRIKPSTIIVGAGWAGIACAIKLVQANHKITIIEATPYLGGRARTVNFANNLLDNGQHILLGAYTETIKLLQIVGITEINAFTRLRLSLNFYGNIPITSQKEWIPLGEATNHHITLPRLPAPLHTLAGLMMAHGLTRKEKLAIASMFIKLYKTKFILPQDCSILTALQYLGQTEPLITKLWEPIALAVMSTPINTASANVFLKVLKDTFTGKSSNSDWLLPKKDLSQILPNPAYKYLLANGANVLLRQPIKAVIYDDHKCIGVTNEQGSWYADNIVLATPPSITAKLLTNKKSLPIATNLSKITYNIITTIYLIFAKPVCLPYLIIGLLDQPAQWIFDRKFVGQPNIVSAIITHNINIPKYTKDELIPAIITQLNKHFPSLPKLVNAKGIQEKRAAFICTPMSQQLRPTHVSGISNLFLTGDYIGNYPATIEGAVRSGINCSQGILGAAAPTTPL